MRLFRRSFLVSLAATSTLLAQHQATPDLLQEASARPPLSLDFLNGLALANNPTLKQSNALVERSAGQARQAGLLPNPSIGYSGEQIRGGDYGGGEQGAFLQQTLVLGGKLGLRRNVYEQQRRSGLAGITEQRTRVLSDVSQQFYSALAAQATLRLRRQLSGIATDAVETAHQLQNVGQADSPDVLQAEVEAEQAALAVTTQQLVYIQEFKGLAALTGKPDLPLALLAGDLDNPPQLNTDQILNRIVRDSPSVERAHQELSRAEAALKAAKRESIPDLTLRAGIQQNYEHLPENSSRPVGVQGFATAAVTIPIFNRNQGNVAAAEADRERAQSEIQRLELSLRQNGQLAIQRYLSDQAQAERYKQAMIPRAQRAYQLYSDKYRAMAAAYPQVIVSQRTLFQLQVSYIELLKDLWMQTISLQNYTLGGGLNEPASAALGSTELNPPGSSAAGAP